MDAKNIHMDAKNITYRYILPWGKGLLELVLSGILIFVLSFCASAEAKENELM